VEIAGGRDARIVVIPTASELRETGRRYARHFEGIRVRETLVLPFESRRECENAEALERLEQATGVFLTGGNQLRLSTMLGGTPVAKSLRLMNARGIVVAGTSAGAAFMSEHMIAFGEEGPTPRGGMVQLAPGLGLTNRTIVDQHFRQRDRLGRLLTALAFNPFAVGIGLDEDTAAFIGPDETLEVVGSGAITIVDPAQLEYSSMDAVKRGDPVCLLGVRLHVLVNGATFNLHSREAAAGAVARGDR
jgi:cyanophycinase